jgi:Uma2 family endonuclease
VYIDAVYSRDETAFMSTVQRPEPISVKAYLAGELGSETKDEYVVVVVYAIARASNSHNLLASNALGALHASLRSSNCRAYNSDTKIRVRMAAQVRFYYPDVSVICRPNPLMDSFQDEPAIVVEVMSRATRPIDEGEKRDAYLAIPSLVAYLLVDQESPSVVVHCRTEQGFAAEIHAGLGAIIPLAEIGIELSLAEVYVGYEVIGKSGGDEVV